MNNPMNRRQALRAGVFMAVGIPAAAVAAHGAASTSGKPAVPHGYGQCSACACPAYSGNGHVCQNCGHNYATHW